MSSDQIYTVLQKHAGDFHPVVRFIPSEQKIAAIDLSKNNPGFTETVFTDTDVFSSYINQKLGFHRAAYLVGGYNEHRNMYRRSELFDKDLSSGLTESAEPRCIHLGTDIWAAAGTSVFAPIDGMVHSFAFNNHHGDYGATIILVHEIDGIKFHSLYGHLSLADLDSLKREQPISKGQLFAHLGKPAENGNWPPHLHFQLIIDIGKSEGDYPGVCTVSDSKTYLQNCPNPDLILGLNQYI